MPDDPVIREDVEAFAEGETLDELLRRAPATMASIIVHLIVLILLALLSLQTEVDEPLVIEVGQAETDAGPQVESLQFDQVDLDPSEEVPATTEVALMDEPIAINAAAVTPEVELMRLARGSMAGYSPSFANRITDAKRNGIEIVVVFDSTGSMGSEIEAVKYRIRAISEAVLEKIPKARFSLVTYRDLREAYSVRGTGLTHDVRKIQQFVNGVYAGGGGDRPEAVQLGMRWALHENDYRRYAQKVMLVFGDAPPHQADLDQCLEMAEAFRGYGKGRVFTVTCKNGFVLPEFYAIARAGGGDAYLMKNSDRLMEDLLVIAFGSEHREQVLRFFEIPDRSEPNRRTRSTGRRRR